MHCLAAYQDFIYVEGYVDGVLRMGFVPAGTVDRQHGYVADYRSVMDHAGVYSEADIQSAMDAAAAFLHENWAGMRLLELQYRDEVNADPNAWWRTEGEDSILFTSILDGIGFVDSEMSDDGPVSDYEWILNRVPGGDWRVVGCGYE